MHGSMLASLIQNRERVLLALYRRLADRVTGREARRIVNQLRDLQDEQLELLDDLIEELEEEPMPERRLAQYIVQRGDTLFIIAQKYNTTVANLLRVNPEIEDPDEIRSGMMINLPIILPAFPECYEEYTVQSGDTLFRIAREFDITVDELVYYNNIRNPDLIFPGRILIVPCPEEEIEDRLSYETIARNNDINFDATLEESFFVATTRSQLKRDLNRFDIRIPRDINFNENIVIGAIEYNIRRLVLQDRTIRTTVERKANGYHLIAVPKDQFTREGIYNVNFVAAGGERLDRDRVRIRF